MSQTRDRLILKVQGLAFGYGAERLQHATQGLTQFRPRYAHEHGRRVRGIKQWSEKVKNRPHAAFRAKFSRRSNILKGRVVIRREEKSEVPILH